MDNKPAIIFQNPLQNYISKTLTLTEAREILDPLVSFCRKYDVEVSKFSIPAIAKSFRSLLEGNRGIPLEALKKIYEGFRSNLDNIVALTSYYPKYRAAWEYILLSPSPTAEQIQKLFGREVKICKVKLGWEYQMVCEAIFFPLHPLTKYNSYYGYQLPQVKYFYLEAEVRRYLTGKILNSKLVEPEFVDELPAGLKIANFEAELSTTELYNLQGISMGGYILKQTGMVMVPRLRKIMESESVKPFEFGNHRLNRAELVTMAYFMCQGTQQRNFTLKELAKYTIDKVPKEILGTQFAAFLPHLYGFTRTIGEQAYFRELTDIVNSLIEQADDRWLCLDNFPLLLLSTQLRNLITPRVLQLFPSEKVSEFIHREDERNRPYNYRNPPEPISEIDEIGIPIAINWIQFLCAMGLLEIAYDPDARITDEVPFGMRYIRLTALGRYAFGQTNDYQGAAKAVNVNIEFDDENHIITDSTPNSPYSMLLSKISVPIGNGRYLISSRSIARECKTPGQVEERLMMLSQLLDSETVKAITPLFAEAQTRLSCGQIDEGYDLIKIRPELDELRQLFVKNEHLSEIVTQLGRNTFLVKHSDLFKVNALLGIEGFKL